MTPKKRLLGAAGSEAAIPDVIHCNSSRDARVVDTNSITLGTPNMSSFTSQQ